MLSGSRTVPVEDEILLAHRTMPATALTTAMDRAVASGCLDPELVLIDARRHQINPTSAT